jgi:ribosomal protein L40E
LSFKSVKKNTTGDIMTSLQCTNCGTNNPLDARFCQKCANKLFQTCKHCGTENALAIKFCKNCGSNLSEAKFSLSDNRVAEWRKILGGLEGWSPAFIPTPEETALWQRITPPLLIDKERVIFRVALTSNAHRMINPAGDIEVSPIVIRNTKFEPVTGSPWTLRLTRELFLPFLIATESRLVIYHLKNNAIEQIPYDQIISFNAAKDRYTLGIKERTQVVIETRLSRLGLLAPTTLTEISMESNAETFVSAFSRFFMEIIEENQRRK